MRAIRAELAEGVRVVMAYQQDIGAEQQVQEIAAQARQRRQEHECRQEETERTAVPRREVLVQVRLVAAETAAVMEAEAPVVVPPTAADRIPRHRHLRHLQRRHRLRQVVVTAADEIQAAGAAKTVDRNC